MSSVSVNSTQIQNITGFAVDSVENVLLTNNQYLNAVELQIWNITQSLVLQGIGQNSSSFAVALPRLLVAQDVLINGATILSMPALSTVNGSFTLEDNYLPALDDVSILGTISGGLSIIGNGNLTNASLPRLTTLAGGLDVSGNGKLTSLQFDLLNNIVGNVNISGPLTDISLPALRSLQGSITINSTAAMSCDAFDQLKEDGVIQGQYSCTTASDRSSVAASSNSSSGGSASSSSVGGSNTGNRGSFARSGRRLSTGAIVGIAMGVVLAFLLLLGGVFGFISRYRRLKIESKIPLAATGRGDEDFDPPSVYEKRSSPDPTGAPQPSEMATGQEAHELPAAHGTSELDKEAPTSGSIILEMSPQRSVEVQASPLEEGQSTTSLQGSMHRESTGTSPGSQTPREPVSLPSSPECERGAHKEGHNIDIGLVSPRTPSRMASQGR
jgi:hypothetical protein